MKNINTITTYSVRGKEKVRVFERRENGVFELINDKKGHLHARPILLTPVWVRSVKGVFPAQFEVCWMHGSDVRWEWLPAEYLVTGNGMFGRWIRKHNIPFDWGASNAALYLDSEYHRAIAEGRVIYSYDDGRVIYHADGGDSQ